MRKRSFSPATGSRRRPWGPRGLANACKVPSRRARRQAVSCEEYRPSRRSKAPTSPGARQASASSSTRSLYWALKYRRLALSGTSGQAGTPQGRILQGIPRLAPSFPYGKPSSITLLSAPQTILNSDGTVSHSILARRAGVKFPRATHLVILVDGYRRWKWLSAAAYQRLLEELAKLDVQLNHEKTRRLDLTRGENFGFLGFDFRRTKTLRGVWGVRYVPEMKARTALLRKLKELFRRFRSQPIDRVIGQINPVLRGWVNYFRAGQSSRCFGYVKDWVERKVRRHLRRARKGQGFGWKRWSRPWLYKNSGYSPSIGLTTTGRKPLRFNRVPYPLRGNQQESPVPANGTPGSTWRVKRDHGSRTEAHRESGDIVTGPYRRRANSRPYR